MNNPPIPCAHCGTNFMRRDLNPDAPKLCNNCENKEKNKPKREKTMSQMPPLCETQINFLITCDRATQIEVEEHCMNQGISISEYFIRMHKTCVNLGYVKFDKEAFEKLSNTIKNFHGKLEWLPDDLKEVHNEFESMAHEREPSLKIDIPMSAIEQEKKDREGFGEGKYKMEHQEALLPVNKGGIRGQNTLANVKFEESPKTKKRKK